MNNKTKKECISIAKNFYDKRLAGQKVTTDSLWSALLQCAPDYSSAYFSRLKYAIAYHQNTIGNGWTAKVVKDIKNPTKVFPDAFPKKTKKRAGTISIGKLTRLVDYLNEKECVEECAALLLIFRTGARPCELKSIKVDGDRVFISGAKKSDSVQRGADRVLECSDEIAADIASYVKALNSSQKSMDAIRLNIYNAVKTLFPHDKKRIGLYTLRHQFGSNLKASNLSRIQMAYIMGHQSTASILSYGDKRQGVAEWVVVKPSSDADLSSVRDKVLEKVWHRAQYKPVEKSMR